MSDSGSFSVPEKNPPSYCFSSPPLAVDGKLVMPLYLFDGFHRRAMSRAVEDYRIYWANLGKRGRLQLWSSRDDTPVTNKDMISIRRVLIEASSAENALFFFDRMLTTISCCRILVQVRALPSVGDIVVAELFRDVQQHRLLGNIKARQVFRIAAGTTCLTCRDECYEAFNRVCKELSNRGVSLALVCFTSVTLCMALLDKKICTGLLAVRTRPLSGEMQYFDSFRIECYIEVFAFLEKVKSAAAAVVRPLREALMPQVLVAGFKEIVAIQKSIAAPLWTFHHSKNGNKKAVQTPLRHLLFQLGTAIVANFAKNTPEPTASAVPASFPPSSPLLLGAVLFAAPHAFVPQFQPPS